MSILQNAIDSIAIGLEDYQSPDDRRIVSSTRNIFAGILLLFKHKLCELSGPETDEALIKQRVLPEIDATGAVRWIGKGKKTVDVQNIKERFESLGISVDWSRLERINRYRNDVEHYFSSLNAQSVQQLISDSFIIIRDFISEHLNEDPKELLGDEAWGVLIEVNEVYEKEKSACVASLETLNYFSEEICDAIEKYSCSECGSGLIYPEIEDDEASESSFMCKSCGNTQSYEEIIDAAISGYYARDLYLSMTDGADSPLADCPECGGIYLYESGVCASCGYAAEQECQRCGATIIPEEMSSSPYCGYCDHVMSKDD